MTENIDPVGPSEDTTSNPADIISNLITAIQEKDTKEVTEEKASQEVFYNIVKQSTEISLEPISQGKNLHRPEIFSTPPAGLDETTKRINDLAQTDLLQQTNAKEWANQIGNGLQTNSYDDAVDNILAREGTHWVQRLQAGNTAIGAMASRADIEAGAILTGTQAINAVQRHLGIGGNFSMVLPHSGFWITLKPPFEDTILELNRSIQNVKVTVGRATHGLMLSSLSGVVSELFVHFALGSMQRNSIKDVDNLLKIISVHDINIIIWAFLCTIYPNGYNHRVPCIADATKCTHVVEDIINVRRLFHINSNAFGPEQLAHLKNSGASSMSVESVTKYREELKLKERKIIKLCEGTEQEVSMTLCVPSAYDYFDSTNRWVNGIGEKVNEALGADASFSERDKIITEHAAASQMRKYSHWVESIDIGGIISDRESIEKSLDAMSSSFEIRKEFDKKVAKYVESTCNAVIGIPDFKCPKCGKYQITQEGTDPLRRSIIGIDVPNTFFTMAVQRAQYFRA